MGSFSEAGFLAGLARVVEGDGVLAPLECSVLRAGSGTKIGGEGAPRGELLGETKPGMAEKLRYPE